jgi:chemotaxis protein methyltransferase CheR
MGEKDRGLDAVVALVAARTGTSVSKQQRERLERELERRLAGRSTQAFLEHLEGRSGAHELAELLAVVSVHKTDLFRDEQQLEALSTHVLRPLALEGRPLKLWSAGCSTGEEVATLLVLLAEAGAHPESTVLGTDLSAEALERARALAFSDEAMRRVPAMLARRYFVAAAGGARLVPSLAQRARFLRHNLVDRPYPVPEGGGGFDVIFCRNVLIYFTAEATRRTLEGLAERLRPGGALVLSAAEPLLETVPELQLVRVPGAFFSVRGPPPAPAPVASLPTPLPRPSSPEAAWPSPRPAQAAPAPAESPEEEGRRLFELVLDWAAAGEGDTDTEAGLRKALYLAPQLAAARYLLGLLLERRGATADAASEYRRALTLLESGTAMPSRFYLNNERLVTACRLALSRLPIGAPPSLRGVP